MYTHIRVSTLLRRLAHTFLLIALLVLSALSSAESSRIKVNPVCSLKSAEALKTRILLYFPDVHIELQKESDCNYVLWLDKFKSDPQAFALSTQLIYRGIDNQIIVNPIGSAEPLGVIIPPTSKSLGFYQFAKNSQKAQQEVLQGLTELKAAVKNPEYQYNHQVNMALSTSAVVQKTLNLTLKDVIFLSLRYNPSIQNAELARIVQRYQLTIAEQEFELNYALTGQYQWAAQKTDGNGVSHNHTTLVTPEISTTTKLGGKVRASLINPISDDGTYNPKAVLSLDQPLLRGFGETPTLQNLRDSIDSEITNKLSLKNGVISQITTVIQSYRALISQKNSLTTARRSLKDAEVTFEVNKKKIKAGQMERTGNIQQAYQVESLKLSLSQSELSLIKAKKALLAIVGLSPKLDFDVPEDVELHHLYVPNLKDSTETALLNNYEYQNLLIQYRIHQRAYEVALNQQLWQLDLNTTASSGGGTLGNRGNSGLRSLTNGSNWATTAGLQLSVPINDVSRKNQVISAKVLIEQDKINILAAKRALITAVSNQIEEIKSNVSQYYLSLKQLDLADRSYQLELKKQQAGISSAIDLTNTQNQLISAKNNLIGLKIGYLNSITDLEQILGTTLSVWNIQLVY